MSLKFWDEAFVIVTYLINRLPTRVLTTYVLYHISLTLNQTIPCLRSLFVHVGPMYGHI
jgi:hypothetical protein